MSDGSSLTVEEKEKQMATQPPPPESCPRCGGPIYYRAVPEDPPPTNPDMSFMGVRVGPTTYVLDARWHLCDRTTPIAKVIAAAPRLLGK